MKKRTTILATLAMLTFGGYVGYVTNYTKKAIAHEYVIPKFTEIPRNNLNIDINLNKNAIAIKGDNPEQDINVNIQKKDSIVYLTSVVEKKVEVPVYIKVREMPSIKESKPVVRMFSKPFNNNQRKEI